jgi:RNase adapter protein RapZ
LSFQRFVVVAGLSGAGKSQAMKSFEDLGFYCIDNLPPRLTGPLVTLCEEAGVQRLAVSLDVRSHGPFGEAQDALAQLETRGVPYEVLFLDASDATIVRRYSETRRRHPFETAGVLMNAIAAERAALADLRERAGRIWDTSGMTHTMLKARIAAAYADGAAVPRMTTRIVAFGFKFGIPLDADLVFDVRFLPNPNYVPELRELTGSDEAVVRYMEAVPATAPFLERLFALVDFLIPFYIDEGKARLTIAIGCTGGRHRSIYVVDRIVAHLRGFAGLAVSSEQRDLVHA